MRLSQASVLLAILGVNRRTTSMRSGALFGIDHPLVFTCPGLGTNEGLCTTEEYTQKPT